MRLSRIISALVGVLAIAALPATAAQAQLPYPPQPPALSLSQSTITVGDSVTIIGRGFGAIELADISMTFRPLAAGVGGAGRSRDGGGRATTLTPVVYEMPGPVKQALADQVTTDGEGTFSKTLRIDQTGVATIVATGRLSGHSATAVLTVMPAGSLLPRTGSDLARQVMIGSLLVAAGGLLVLLTIFWRRRGASHGQHAPDVETVHREAARR
jgi:hypothetical protein